MLSENCIIKTFFRFVLLMGIFAVLCCTVHAQEKQINFKAGYSVTTVLEKNNLVIGSELQITDNTGTMLFDGTISQIFPQLEVFGIKYIYEGGKKVEQTGSFIVSNLPDGTFILHSKKGQALDFKITEYGLTTYETETIVVDYSKTVSGCRLMTICWKPSESDLSKPKRKEKLSVKVDETLIDRYGFADIDALQENTLSGYEMVWSDGTVFKGNIKCYEESDGTFYHFETGSFTTKNGTDSMVVDKDNPGDYIYYKEYTGENAPSIFSLSVQVPGQIVAKNGLWNTVTNIAGGKRGTFKRNDGVTFSGEYNVQVADGAIQSITWLKGKMTWRATGDEFEGDLTGTWIHGLPIDGVLRLAGGESPSEWWKTYELSDEEWEVFERFATPLEKFQYADARILAPKVKELENLIKDNRQKDALRILIQYKGLASRTDIADTWEEMTETVSHDLELKRIKSVTDALFAGKFEKALAIAESDRISVTKYAPEFNYSGKMGSGTATYGYKLAADGLTRIYEGQFDYKDSELSVRGFFKNGKRDGEWIAYRKTKSGQVTFLYLVYSNGHHNGFYQYFDIGKYNDLLSLAYVEARLDNNYFAEDMISRAAPELSGAWTYSSKWFSNGKFDGPFHRETDDGTISGEFKNGVRVGIWKETYKTDHLLWWNSHKEDIHYADYTRDNVVLYGFNEETGEKYNERVYFYIDNEAGDYDFEEKLPGPANSYYPIQPADSIKK